MIPPNWTNATQAKNIQIMLRHALPIHPKTFNVLKKVAGIPPSAEPIINVKNSDLHSRRIGTVFKFVGNNRQLRIIIKKFQRDAGRNQIGRKSLSDFCRNNHLNTEQQNFLKVILLRKAKGEKGKHTHLVFDDEKERVQSMFANVEIGASTLLGSDHPQVLAIFCEDDKLWHFYDMEKQVLPLVRQSNVGFTSKSNNITLGDYIELQRKGSEKGEHSGGHPVTDIRHRANDIQIIMRVKKIFDEVEPVAYIKI